MAMGSKAFESPLISHARMRALYRALVETRVLSEGAGRASRFAKGLEACWVATAIDLHAADLINQTGGTALIEHVIRVGRREGAKAAAAADVRAARRGLAEEAKAAKFAGTTLERLLCAVGQAMALKSAAQKRVVVAYAEQDALKPAEWKRLFRVADADLPLILVALPSKKQTVDLERAARGADGRALVPVIPVDAGDAVGIYRVAQESIGRARAHGGVAVIECVSTVVDPVKLMRTQLLKKGICTEVWAAGVDASFRRLAGSI